MSNVFTSAASLLASTIKASASTSITYSRSGEDNLSISAGKSTPEIEAVEPGTDYTTLFRVTDWIITAADFFSTPPGVGDTITDGSLRYEVIEMPDEGTYRYSDPGHTIMRIHSKEIR